MCGYRLFDNILECECSCLKAHRNNRLYNTKMDCNSLPEHYCDVNRYGMVYDIIDSRGVSKLEYKWFKMNHFMRDSSLWVSFTNGDEAQVYSNEIFKYLYYVNKYDRYDIYLKNLIHILLKGIIIFFQFIHEAFFLFLIYFLIRF